NANGGRIFKGRSDRRRTGTAGGSGQRCRRCNQDAGSEAKTVWKFRRQESRMTAKGLRKCRLWTARKTKNRFPIAAHEPLEIALAISTFPQPRPRPPWESENPHAGFPLSHSDFLSCQINQKRKEINPSPKPCPSGSSQDWNVLVRRAVKLVMRQVTAVLIVSTLALQAADTTLVLRGYSRQAAVSEVQWEKQ